MAEYPFRDNPNIRPVAVIASFSNKGEVIPLYFKCAGNKYKIDNIASKTFRTDLQEDFMCEFMDGGQASHSKADVPFAVYVLDGGSKGFHIMRNTRDRCARNLPGGVSG